MPNDQVANQRAAVFGATGATGREIGRELLRRGFVVRAVSRSIDNLKRDFADTDADLHVANLADRGDAIGAAEDCDVIFHCVGLPLHSYHLHPRLVRNTAAAMNQHGARGVLVTSFWSYGPVGSTSVSEDQPPVNGCGKCEVRREMEEIMLEAGGAAALLPDFYGPGADVSMLNDALAAVASGKPALWPGDPDAPRDFIYIPDTGPVLCDLASRPRAYGERWNVPGSGAVPPRQLIEMAGGGQVKIRRGRRWMLTLGGIFKRDLREFKDVFPLYDGPYGPDASRITGLLDDLELTAYEEAIASTMAWLQRQR